MKYETLKDLIHCALSDDRPDSVAPEIVTIVSAHLGEGRLEVLEQLTKSPVLYDRYDKGTPACSNLEDLIQMGLATRVCASGLLHLVAANAYGLKVHQVSKHTGGS